MFSSLSENQFQMASQNSLPISGTSHNNLKNIQTSHFIRTLDKFAYLRHENVETSLNQHRMNLPQLQKEKCNQNENQSNLNDETRKIGFIRQRLDFTMTSNMTNLLMK
jgi:hypothetical protein